MRKFSKLLALVMTVIMLVMSLPMHTGADDIILDFSDLFKDPEPEDNNKNDKDNENDDTVVTPEDDEDTDVDVQPDDNITDADTNEDAQTDETVTDGDAKEDDTKEDVNLPEQEEIVYNTTFSDVTEDKWFYEYVTSLASVGIIEGYEDGTFLPQNSITRAEFVKLLAATMKYELTESDEFEDVKNTDWFYKYVSASVKNGVIDKEDYKDGFKPSEKITRQEVAKLVVYAIGAEKGKYATPYADTDDENVVALYAQCIMQGSANDDKGNLYFYPDSDITRAEISTVMSRLIEYNQDSKAYVERKMAEYNMTELKLLGFPFSKGEFSRLIRDLGDAYPLSVVLENKNSGLSHDEICDNIIQAFNTVSMTNPQDFSLMGLSMKQVIYPEKQLIQICLESTANEYSKEQLQSMKNKASQKAKQIVQMLFDEKFAFSDFEKARFIHNYLVKNTEYATNTDDQAIYTAYGALINGKAVCQGYASAFNLLCDYAQIDSYAVWNDEHMWNVVFCDGQQLYYDTTWDDPVPNDDNVLRENFCGITESRIVETHKNVHQIDKDYLLG